jgi:type I restriction-modification system DNA methylase subunit
MADPKKIENAIRRVHNQKSFIQELLIDALGWDIDQRAEDVEEISFEWSAEELRANELDKHLVDGTIRQIRPFKGNPWGIFILEFRNPDVFATGRGMTGPLRNVLRGLVPSKRKRSDLKSFNNENLLFICNHDYKHYRFAHFKTPEKNGQTAPLAAFGWGPDDPIRTLCEFNLSALEWPDGQPDAEGWVAAWSQAFDVEKVTKRFYEDYAAVFEKVEKLIGNCVSGTLCVPLPNGTRSVPDTLQGDDLRMFTQTLFNRLMFLRFMERKGWLTFDGQKNYLRALYAAGGHGMKSFYQGRLCPLFFEGLAVEGKQESDAYGCVPYLNGGLFEQSELDKQVTDLPDEVFAGILADEHAGGLFYRYNFTVEESTPLDIEVAVDPEMLGKVFEELVTGRHESGSYYTPRPVVSFMCREAIKGFLSDKLVVSGTLRVPSASGTRSVPDTAAAIAALVDRHDVSKLKETHAREILAALDDLKAVDPACGSGAYLLGLLQETIALYRLLYSEKLVKDARTLYDLKLRIISQSLYGVDIDPFATNIAKLRLWLSLAVEAENPVPLPNLDFKIETGDSVLAPDPQEMPDLFRAKLQFSADVLAMVKNQFFLSHGEEKEEYRKTIVSQESYLRQELAAEHGEGVVDWRIQFAEAFANKRGGFDMVLANPPYVRQELIKDIKPKLKECFPDIYCGTADLYCYFYARGFQLLRRGGMLVFISPNKWFRANYGKALRAHIADTCQVQSITDFGELPVFDTAATFPMIFVARKERGASSPIFTQVKSLGPPYPDVLALVKSVGQVLPQEATRGSD